MVAALRGRAGSALSVEEVADASGATDDPEAVFHVLEHLAANPDHGVRAMRGGSPFETKYLA